MVKKREICSRSNRTCCKDLKRHKEGRSLNPNSLLIREKSKECIQMILKARFCTYCIVKIFLPNLSKLLSNDTKEKALQEILKVFNDTGTKPEWLKIYLQELLKRRISKKGLINFEMEIIALNHLIRLNGQNFIDPRSKVNTLESTIKKVTDLYKIAMSIESSEVHRAVAQGYIHILESCIKPKYGLDLEKINEMLIIPLQSSIEKGEDKVAQVAAAHVYYFMVKAAYESEYNEVFKFLYSKYLDTFKAFNIENEDYIDCMSYLIQNGGIKPAAEFIGSLIRKCLKVLNSKDVHNPKAKTSACYLLFLLARKLHEVGDIIFEPFGYTVLSKLDSLRFGKNLKLKNEAIKAYDEWKSLENCSRSNSIDLKHFDYDDLQ
ncbi:unnamed protein product [Moneuplotes crassus]|uniref:Uncharacterized protein n=1 Tax=Euplotes crassus TaxID=5936 RepID=A0AAD2DCL8_EUPCR|nr:unnamed protein product [Moneuplotes crassus]